MLWIALCPLPKHAADETTGLKDFDCLERKNSLVKKKKSTGLGKNSKLAADAIRSL